MKWAAFVLGLSAVWLGGCASDSPPFAPGSRVPDDDDAGDATDGARTAELRVLHAGSALPPVDVWVGSEKDGGKAITGTAYGELSEWTTIGFADATTPVEVIESASGTSLGKAEYYDRTTTSFGANYYLDGQNLKLTAEYADIDYDTPHPTAAGLQDQKILTLGLQFVF